MNVNIVSVWKEKFPQTLKWRKWAWSMWSVSSGRMARRANIPGSWKDNMEAFRRENSRDSVASAVSCSVVGAVCKLLMNISPDIRWEWDCGYRWHPGWKVLCLTYRPPGGPLVAQESNQALSVLQVLEHRPLKTLHYFSFNNQNLHLKIQVPSFLE